MLFCKYSIPNMFFDHWLMQCNILVVCLHCQPIILVLLDITPMLPVLDGVVMELQDCALPLLRGEGFLLLI